MKLLFTRTLVLFTLIFGLLPGQLLAEDAAKLKVGDKAPTFFLRDLDGENFFLSRSLKQEKPILLSFFANWCKPCRAEIPELEKLFKKEEFSDVELVYIHLNEPTIPKGSDKTDIETIRQSEAELGIAHPILYDRYGVVATKYSATSLPTTIIIGPDGLVKYSHTGYAPGDENHVAKLLLELIKD